jgi:hypothetical protein
MGLSAKKYPLNKKALFELSLMLATDLALAEKNAL